MTIRSFRASLASLGLILVVALVASSCSGSDSDSAVSSGTDDKIAADEIAANEASADGLEGDAPVDGDASDEPETSETDPVAVDPSDVDLHQRATSLIRDLFNIDPSPDAIDCIVAESEGRPNLATALINQEAFFSDLDDATLQDINYSVNGCVDAAALAEWVTEAVGPQGPVRETAPPCFAEHFGDPDDGDGLFHAFVALSFQFDYDPEFVPGLTDTLVACAPVRSLAGFFINDAEASSGYSTVIDADCFEAAIDNDETSRAFWSTLIDRSAPPTSVVQEELAACGTSPDDGLEPSVPSDFVPWSGTGELAEVSPMARADLYDAPPPMAIDPAGSYEAVLVTGGGEIRVTLFADTAPITVNNFVSLARDGYFDGTVFHRVLEDFMAQGGDPTGTGSGGPGYQFADETEGGPALDRPGLLAMANAGPGTNGSQFFITFAPTEWLTGNHTVFGEVTAGMDIVNTIERRDPGAPQGRGQALESVTIIEG